MKSNITRWFSRPSYLNTMSSVLHNSYRKHAALIVQPRSWQIAWYFDITFFSVFSAPSAGKLIMFRWGPGAACMLTPEGPLTYETISLEHSSFENLLSWSFLISAHFSLNIPPFSCWLMTNWRSTGMGQALGRKRASSGPLQTVDRCSLLSRNLSS